MAGNDRSIKRAIYLSTAIMSAPRKLVTLGMFIIDEFSFLDAAGKPTGHTLSPQEGSTSRLARIRLLILLFLHFRLGEAVLIPTSAPASGKVSLP
jgi:hypothetical protein